MSVDDAATQAQRLEVRPEVDGVAGGASGRVPTGRDHARRAFKVSSPGWGSLACRQVREPSARPCVEDVRRNVRKDEAGQRA